jgi:hypothetical protein
VKMARFANMKIVQEFTQNTGQEFIWILANLATCSDSPRHIHQRPFWEKRDSPHQICVSIEWVWCILCKYIISSFQCIYQTFLLALRNSIRL